MYQYRPQDVDINFDAWIYDSENDNYTESKVSIIGKEYHSVIRQDYFAIKLTIGDTIYPDPEITGIIPFSPGKWINSSNFTPTEYIENKIGNLRGNTLWNLSYFYFKKEMSEISHKHQDIGDILISENKGIEILLFGKETKNEQGDFSRSTRYYVFPKTEEFGKDFHKYDKAKFPIFSK